MNIMMETSSYEICTLDSSSCSSFMKGTPSIRKTIVDVGSSVYDNLHLWMNIKSSSYCSENETSSSSNYSEYIIKDLQKQLNDVIANREEYIQYHTDSKTAEIDCLKRKLEENNNDFEKKLKTEREYYVNQIELLKEDRETYLESNIRPKVNEIEYLRVTLCETRELMEKRKDEELRRLEDSQSRYVESLKNQIEQLKSLCEMQDVQLKEKEDALSTKKNMNIVKMGQIGEASVEEYISRHFIEGTVENTSKTGGQGDLHFTYKNCDILLEVKNKDRITSDDITKFIRDVKETDCIGGVFVSIKPTVNIPCHSCYDVEWINESKPIIYITSFETIPDMLYVAIKTVYYYHSKRGLSEEDCSKYKDELESLIDHVKMIKPILEEASINMKRSMESINKLQSIIKEQLNIYFDNEESRGSKMAIVLKTCNEFAKINNRLPNYDELSKLPGLSRKDIGHCGGMQCIKDEYKNKYS